MMSSPVVLVVLMRLTEAEEILEVVHTRNIDLSESGVKAKIRAAREVFIREYRGDPKAFIERYVRIIDGNTNEEIPFLLNPAQDLLVKQLSKRWLSAPKARQLGITTLTNALALHHALFTKNADVICMAVKTDNAKENLRRIKTMYSKFPKWLQKFVLHSDEKEGHQNNTELWSFHSKLVKTNNKLQVATASSEDATRGKTPTFLHWTETAFADHAKEIFTSVFPALNRRKDSLIILESTGNGNAGFYYEVCLGIRKGFEVVFMPWFLDRGYQVEGEPFTDLEKEVIADLMGVKKVPDELTDAQLRWYQQTNETIGKAKCQQEYPINIEQVFQSTSLSFFSAKTMQAVTPAPAEYHLKVVDGFLQRSPRGPCQVFSRPRPDYEYMLVADTSEGVEDSSSISVIDPDGNEVAHWHELLQPDDVVKVIVLVANHYGQARVVVENNGIGAYVLNSLRSQFFYPNIYSEEQRMGVRTHATSKPVMLSMLQEKILSGELTFNNPVLLEEMKTFEADTLKHQKGAHDDVIMSSAIAAWVFDRFPPKKKRIKEEYRDYTNQTDHGRDRRRFILGRS